MNKYVYIIGVLLVIVIGGISYNTFLVAEENRPIETGVVREITITARENRWAFEPETFTVDQGDRVIITLVNEDGYDHGFAIDAFGITQRLPANRTIRIEFVATKAGEFPYYCSVSCGAGIVDGAPRGHFDQIGRLIVRALEQSTAPGDASLPRTEEGSEPPLTDTPGPSAVDATRIASLIPIANERASELGYDITRLPPVYDVQNERWERYHMTLGLPFLNDPLFAFMHDRNAFYTVFYAPQSGGNPYLWVFLDTASGEVLGYIEQ